LTARIATRLLPGLCKYGFGSLARGYRPAGGVDSAPQTPTWIKM